MKVLAGTTPKPLLNWNQISSQVAESTVQERIPTYLTPTPQRMWTNLMIARDAAMVLQQELKGIRHVNR